MSSMTMTRPPYRALSTLVLATVLATVGVTCQARADTYRVDNTKDHGSGSFKKAVTLSNKAQGRDLITFKNTLRGEIPVRKEQAITDPLRIEGNGNDDLVLTGVLSGSRLEFTTNRRIRSRVADLSLDRVSIEAHGPGGDRGGMQVIDASLDGDNSSNRDGIYAYKSPLVVTGTKVTRFLRNGVVASRTPAEITDSTIDGNGADGVYSSSDDMVIEGSTLSANREYGAVAEYGAFIGLMNSTVSGNGDPTDVRSGGINGNNASFKIESSTITDNFFAPGGGLGGVGAAMSGTNEGTITIGNSVIAGNHGRNCSPDARFLSEGGNVFEEAAGCDGLTGKDKVADPLLGPLGNNGGPTKTHALGAGSPAIGNATADSPDVDQRGIERDAAPDSGAYELTGD